MDVKSILIVEDESVVALNIAHIVESLGYRSVGPIATGFDALKIVERDAVDLVLMDIKLKGPMDGIELARRISLLRPVPIVFLTAYTDNRTLSRAKTTEPYGYITKSFDEGELHSTIEMALYKFEMQQKLLKEQRLLAATLASILEAVVTTDHEGKVRYMNPAAVRLLGLEAHEAKGKRLDSLVTIRSPEGDQIAPSDLCAEEPGRGEAGGVYTVGRGSNGGIPVEWKTTRISPFGNRDAETVHVVRDLTARFRAEAAQRRLISLVESSDDAIITVSPSARIESWNSGAEKVFGYDGETAVGLELSLVTSEFLPFDIVEAVGRVGRGEEVEPFEVVCLRRDGSPVDVAIKIQGIRDFNGSIASVSVIARDVTARRNLDKKLREILNREQTRIGQDLHDSIGQMITGVLLKSKVLEQRLRSQELEGEADEISDIKGLLTETLLKLRDLARGLIPATILSDGLVFAVRRLAQDTESLCGLRVAFTADAQVEISDELVGAEVYHIVEEALNNALKHSSCRTVEVRMRKRSQEIVVSIADDGRGLPKQGDGNGLGLKIMRHRAELIGASISVTSGGMGTEVTCRIPLARRDRRES